MSKKVIIEEKEMTQEVVIKLNVEATRLMPTKKVGEAKLSGIECTLDVEGEGSPVEVAGVLFSAISQMFNNEEDIAKCVVTLCRMAQGKGAFVIKESN